MGDDSGEAHGEAIGNFLIDISCHDEAQHFALSRREHAAFRGRRRALRFAHCLWLAAASGVGMFGKAQEVAHQFFFGAANVDAVEGVGEQRARFAAHKHNGLVAVLPEKGRIGRQGFWGNEEMEKAVGLFLGQVAGRGIRGQTGVGHHAPDDLRKPERRERVAHHDCDLRRLGRALRVWHKGE